MKVIRPDKEQRAVLRGLMRDLAVGLRQQMYFWGRDVVHSSGNLLVGYGMERSESRGLKGTSCYRIGHAEGLVELHGACAGYYEEDRSYLYVRNRGRCYAFAGVCPPAPGTYEEAKLLRVDPLELYERSLPLVRWWREYESWIAGSHPEKYRRSCWQVFSKLPSSVAWLPPRQAREWLRDYCDRPMEMQRSRRWLRKEGV